MTDRTTQLAGIRRYLEELLPPEATYRVTPLRFTVEVWIWPDGTTDTRGWLILLNDPGSLDTTARQLREGVNACLASPRETIAQAPQSAHISTVSPTTAKGNPR